MLQQLANQTTYDGSALIGIIKWLTGVTRSIDTLYWA
jgi:hypothetical protein